MAESLANDDFSESRVILDIDLAKIRANYEAIRETVEPLTTMAVLKADGYGLGAQRIAECLKDAGVTWFGVAEMHEAMSIRHLNLPIQILGGVIAEEIPDGVRNDIILPITDMKTAEEISTESIRQGKVTQCHFLIDSGMGRLGIRISEAEELIMEIMKLPNIECNGIYSHFPYAYGDYDFSTNQVRSMIQLIQDLERKGISFKYKHIANSDGIHNVPSAIQAPFNMVRTGINLYGCFDLEGRKTISLDEVITLRSRLVGIRDMPWGASIGYGRTYKLDEATRVGTVAIGYADGLPIGLSNNGYVIIHGKRCPIIGRVSMDYITVSLDEVPEAQVGDEVVCLGDGISVADWAEAKRTITYEIICSFGNRVERNYINGDGN
ncbi:Alanine racemase like protein [Aduncisulcus paluster]|uniref:Alanine racemase like protein n=1 Tax=Aduncisulcus paluster TaxID=2918883 RepID=A0ABQ5KKX7_9EUKA|nr:Alanine racemase like protein [Aduncisulcus paluster]